MSNPGSYSPQTQAKTEYEFPSLQSDIVRLHDSKAAKREAARIVDDLEQFLDILPPSNVKYNLLQGARRLRSKGTPAETVIAFCGETGAGKSSLINALLGEHYVRTSGMAACTAVVTEIRFNANSTIEADVEYLTTAEWKSELEQLLRDLRDTPGGRIKPRNDFTGEAAVAWEKIYAVYPAVNEDMLSNISAGQLLAENSAVTLVLDNTAHIVVQRSELQKFGTELSRFLDPQDDSSVTGSYWPLIRKISVRVPAPVLSTGAVLVDLPGTADSNVARSKIAEDYLRCANRFFVVSPITRAVSSKVARDLIGEAFKTQLQLDGKYSSRAMTFIVTKCDELSTREVANEPALKPILAKSDELKEIDGKIRTIQAMLDAQQAASEDLGDPIRMGKQAASEDLCDPIRTKKQKLNACNSVFCGTEQSQRSFGQANRTVGPIQGHQMNDPNLENECDSRAGSSFHDIGARLEWYQMMRYRVLSRCRSDWSKKTLQRIFRESLQNPPVEDFDADDSESEFISHDIDMDTEDDDYKPLVFACSARDYMHIKKKTPSSDIGTVCFTDEEDTEIPALSRWIHELTVPVREQASLDLFIEAKNVLASVSAFIEGTPHVTPNDRRTLQSRWRSNDREFILPPNPNHTTRELRALHYGVQPTSIISRLINRFEDVSDAVCDDLDSSVTSSLEQMCRDHATLAAGAVLGISDKFASDMHWQTYRATLRRHGVFKKDLNTELTLSFTKRIASSWTHMVRVRLASSFKLKKRAMVPITSVLDEVTASVPYYLKPCAETLRASAITIARSSLGAARDAIMRAWEEDLKRTTRILVPFVQQHLSHGYERAANAPRKKGISERQKKLFRDHLKTKKDIMFNEAALALRAHLIDAIQKVRDTLDEHLENVAKKVETHMAVLWEFPVDSEENVKARTAALATLREHRAEVERWIQAPRHSQGTANS